MSTSSERIAGGSIDGRVALDKHLEQPCEIAERKRCRATSRHRQRRRNVGERMVGPAARHGAGESIGQTNQPAGTGFQPAKLDHLQRLSEERVRSMRDDDTSGRIRISVGSL